MYLCTRLNRYPPIWQEIARNAPPELPYAQMSCCRMTSLAAGGVGATCADLMRYRLYFAAYGGDQRSAVGSRPGKHPAANFFI